MNNVVLDKSFCFAVNIVGCCDEMQKRTGNFVLSKQLMRAGTAIGALIREAQYAESRADFAHKMAIALKGANETAYWLELAAETGNMRAATGSKLTSEVRELIKLLTSIVNSAKARGRRPDRTPTS